MDRRTFLAMCSATGVSLLARTSDAKQPDLIAADYSLADLFPTPPPVRRIVSVPLSASARWEEVTLYTCLQGIVNRANPRIYFVQDENDHYWLEYYRDRYGIEVSHAESPQSLLEQFAGEVKGYVIYDTENLDTANVATTMAGLDGVLPVSPDQVGMLEGLGVRMAEDLRGRWKDRYRAYRWAHRELWPRCNARLLGGACVDVPVWPSDSLYARDYQVAHTIFTFDLSASLRDREDLALMETIFESATSPGCFMGWRCCRCNEHEMVALAARHDISVLCALGTRNLSIHSAIPREAAPYTQKHMAASEARAVERKIYISFMATDGDSTSSMIALQAGRFRDPEHGTIPFSWGFLPAALDLMPGIARGNYELKTDNDYFVVPSSGVLYTYPFLQPRARDYLRASRDYMRRADLRAAYMINWIDDFWWQEMDLPEFVPMLREELPDCIGFMRGQGESPFERQYVGDGIPYVFSGEGIHRDSDVYSTFADFIQANPIRPLFIFCLTNHSMTLGRIRHAMEQLPTDEVALVRLDEFLHLVNKAHAEGLIPADDFYPEKSGLRAMLQADARAQWPGAMARIDAHATRATITDRELRARVDDPLLRVILKNSATTPADVIAYDAIWDSMLLTKLALNLRGVYVNDKKKAVDDFVREFGGESGADTVADLWFKWLHWREQRIRHAVARSDARQVQALAVHLQSIVMS